MIDFLTKKKKYDLQEDIKRIMELSSEEGMKHVKEVKDGILTLILEKGNGYAQLLHKEGLFNTTRSWYETGTVTKKHHHENTSELIQVVKGEAYIILFPEDENVKKLCVKVGEHCYIPKNVPHIISFKTYTVLIIIQQYEL